MTSTDEWLRIESLDLEAQGVAHNAEGKVVFVEDALAGEEVQVAVRRRKNNWEQATLVALRRPSAQRVVPRCPHFGVCGGCALQHLHVGAQVATKQRALEDALWHLGKVRPEQMLRPIEGPAWGYRQRARLSVRHVAKKGRVLVGFHERKSSYVADIRSCDVLPRACQRLLLPLRELVGAMRARDRLPQIELAVGDTTTALVLRHLEPLLEEDLERLRALRRGARRRMVAAAQGPGHGAAARRRRRRSWPTPCPSSASACRSGRPTSPRSTATSTGCWSSRAVRLLAPEPGERVDRLVLRPRQLHPAAGDPGGVGAGSRGQRGAARPGPRRGPPATAWPSARRFEAANLFEVTPESLARDRAGRALADRSAARGRVRDRQGAGRPAPSSRCLAGRRRGGSSTSAATRRRWPAMPGCSSIVPATAAAAAGAVNMFPHTTHVESIAVFDRL